MDCDRILVMDNGHIVEFEKPKELLRDKQSLFYNLVERSNNAGCNNAYSYDTS